MEREIKKRSPRKNSAASGQPDTCSPGETKSRDFGGAPCKSCNHQNRSLLEEMILDGAPFLRIEQAIAVGDKSVDPTDVAIKRHAQRCIPDIMQRRIDAILEKDELTADLVMYHIKDALRQSKESAELAFEEDEHGVVREAAQGRSAAIRTRVECARAGGELIGLFQSSKIEMLIKSPEAQGILVQIVEAICPDCAVKVREILGEENV